MIHVERTPCRDRFLRRNGKIKTKEGRISISKSFSNRFMEPNVIILASGILPFGSIFIEM